MSSRYNSYDFIQPVRVIPLATTDIIHTFTTHDNLDNLANEFYDDPTLSWVIMCANPAYFMEFQIPAGAQIRIPLPIERVWSIWGEVNEI